MKYDFDSPNVAILRSLYSFDYLTAKQVCSLLYTESSIMAVRQRLNELSVTEEEDKEKFGDLFEERKKKKNKQYLEWLERSPRYSNIVSGGNELVYWLSVKGRNILKKQGYNFDRWNVGSAQMKNFIKSSHFNHYMAMADFLINITRIPTMTVPGMFSDFALKRERYASVMPDGWLDILYKGKHHYFCLEVDMGTEKEKEWKEKIGCIVYFMQDQLKPSYRDAYGLSDALWLVWTPKGIERRDQLLLWTEEQLLSMYQSDKSKWFYFASCELSTTILNDRIWAMPYGKKLVSILV